MVETPLITKAFLLTAVSKKAAHFSLFVKIYFENSYKKLGPAFLRDPDFLNLVTLAYRQVVFEFVTHSETADEAPGTASPPGPGSPAALPPP